MSPCYTWYLPVISWFSYRGLVQAKARKMKKKPKLSPKGCTRASQSALSITSQAITLHWDCNCITVTFSEVCYNKIMPTLVVQCWSHGNYSDVMQLQQRPFTPMSTACFSGQWQRNMLHCSQDLLPLSVSRRLTQIVDRKIQHKDLEFRMKTKILTFAAIQMARDQFVLLQVHSRERSTDAGRWWSCHFTRQSALKVAAGVALGREDAAGLRVLYSPQVQHSQQILSQGKLLILQQRWIHMDDSSSQILMVSCTCQEATSVSGAWAVVLTA